MEENKQADVANCICHMCGATLKNKSTLREHFLYSHPTQLFMCALCPKIYRVRRKLVKHLMIHNADERFQCDYCPKKFALFGDWKRHVRYHSFAKKHHCDSCTKSFKHNCELRKHINTVHLNIRNCICNVCGAGFGTKTHLKRHSYLHTGLKPYKCQFCGKECTQSTNLKIHIMGVHKELSHLVYKKELSNPVNIDPASVVVPSYEDYVKETKPVPKSIKPIKPPKKRTGTLQKNKAGCTKKNKTVGPEKNNVENTEIIKAENSENIKTENATEPIPENVAKRKTKSPKKIKKVKQSKDRISKISKNKYESNSIKPLEKNKKSKSKKLKKKILKENKKMFKDDTNIKYDGDEDYYADHYSDDDSFNVPILWLPEYSEKPQVDDIKEEPLSPKVECPSPEMEEGFVKDEYSDDKWSKTVGAGKDVKKEDDSSKCCIPKAVNDEIKSTVYDKDTTDYDDIKAEDKKENKFNCKISNIADTKTIKSSKEIKSDDGESNTKIIEKSDFCKLCTVCSKEFRSRTGLYTHMINIHHQCTLCSKVLDNPEAVKRHRKNDCCQDCDEMGITKDQCKNHKERVVQPIQRGDKTKSKQRSDKSCYCDVCGIKLSDLRALKVHLVNMHSTVKFQCDQCPKYYPEEWKLERHKLVHSGDEPFKCKLCPKKFVIYSTLKIHMTSHSSARDCVCHICSKKFKNKHGLRKHIETVHMNVRKYVCNVCGAAFKGNYQLKHHLFLHTGEKPYVCQFCGKECTQASNLKIHIMGVHKDLSHLVYKKEENPFKEVDPELATMPKFSKDYLNTQESVTKQSNINNQSIIPTQSMELTESGLPTQPMEHVESDKTVSSEYSAS